jgi:mRNA-degrading endonuclease YafQ of YafQ-DinJ toxin-antitoxin module
MGCSPVCTRTIEHTNKFKRDYKRETKGRSLEYVRKLDTELAAVVQVLRTDVKWKDHRDCHVRADSGQV